MKAYQWLMYQRGVISINGGGISGESINGNGVTAASASISAYQRIGA